MGSGGEFPGFSTSEVKLICACSVMTSKECWRSERPVRPEVKPRTERNFLSSYVPPVIATQAAMMVSRIRVVQ